MWEYRTEAVTAEMKTVAATLGRVALQDHASERFRARNSTYGNLIRSRSPIIVGNPFLGG